jgi:hypothetical protein
MPQWEYCYVSHRGNEAGYLAHYTAQGVAMSPIQPEVPAEGQDGTDARARLICQLGEEGWELVTVLRVQDEHLPPGATWYFKRPKPTG